MNYINRFQNAQALTVSVGNIYYEYQLMHICLENFLQGVKYTAQIENHQAELRMEETFTDQKYLYITWLHTDYLNLDRSLDYDKNINRANIVQTKCNFLGVLTTL